MADHKDLENASANLDADKSSEPEANHANNNQNVQDTELKSAHFSTVRQYNQYLLDVDAELDQLQHFSIEQLLVIYETCLNAQGDLLHMFENNGGQCASHALVITRNKYIGLGDQVGQIIQNHPEYIMFNQENE